MRMITVWLMLAMTAPALAAQQGAPPDTARAARLRAEIERRFGEHVRRQLNLSDEQAAKLHATQERFGERRRPLMMRQMQLRMALRDQMRPGQAANADSVGRIMNDLQAGRAQLFKLGQEQEREMAGYLTPVQQAQFQIMRERFERRVRELRRGKPGGPQGRRGMRPPRDGPPRRPPQE